MYASRVLPPEEWPRLQGTDLETVWRNLNPADAYVFVVEDGDRIVATVAGLRYVVMECAWVHPEYRGRPGVTRRLLRGMYAVARRLGATRMMTLPANDAVQRIVEKLGGVRLPRVFVVPVSEGDRHGA